MLPWQSERTDMSQNRIRYTITMFRSRYINRYCICFPCFFSATFPALPVHISQVYNFNWLKVKSCVTFRYTLHMYTWTFKANAILNACKWYLVRIKRIWTHLKSVSRKYSITWGGYFNWLQMNEQKNCWNSPRDLLLQLRYDAAVQTQREMQESYSYIKEYKIEVNAMEWQNGKNASVVKCKNKMFCA